MSQNRNNGSPSEDILETTVFDADGGYIVISSKAARHLFNEGVIESPDTPNPKILQDHTTIFNISRLARQFDNGLSEEDAELSEQLKGRFSYLLDCESPEQVQKALEKAALLLRLEGEENGWYGATSDSTSSLKWAEYIEALVNTDAAQEKENAPQAIEPQSAHKIQN